MLNNYDLAQQLALECVKARIPKIINSNSSHDVDCSTIAKEYNEYLRCFKEALITSK